MSMDDYSALSTERLLEMFVAAAKRMGYASGHLEMMRRLRADLAIGPIENMRSVSKPRCRSARSVKLCDRADRSLKRND